MKPNTARHSRFDGLIRRAVTKVVDVAGPLVEREDLEQAARLAMLEAEYALGTITPERRRQFLRRRIIDGILNEVQSYVAPGGDPVDVDDLSEAAGLEADLPADSELDALELIDDDETDAAAVAAVVQSAAADKVREVVGAMPPETAKVVRMRFGLDGADTVDPVDLADILDEDPEVVQGHLQTAELLFQHFTTEQDERGLAPLGRSEFDVLRQIGDLAGYDLRQVALNNIHLEDCDLNRTLLSGTNLWGARLFRANLVGANLWGAQIDGADLQQADLRGATLERATLRSTNLRLANLSGATLWGADLVGAQLDHADLSGCDMRAVNLAGVNMSRTDLTGIDLSGADLRGCDLSGVSLVNANLRSADLTDADLRWADLRNCDLRWTDLTGADLHDARLHGVIRSPNFDALDQVPKPRRLRPVVTAGTGSGPARFRSA